MARTSRSALPADRPPGLKQLAASLGISPGTVSKALNNRYGVDPDTRERVLAEAKRIGYVPDAAARRLKSHPLLRAGLFFSPFLGPRGEINPAALATVETLRRSALRRRVELTVMDHVDHDTFNARCGAHDFDVAIAYGHFEGETLDCLDRHGVPAVLLQHATQGPRQISVLIDTRAAAYEAALYLAALGHREIALVAGPRSELHHDGYHGGFAEAVDEFALHSPPAWRLSLPPDQVNETGSSLAVAPLLAATRRPTAIVFGSDWLASGGLRAARKAGLSVPENLSLVGFDNLPMSAKLRPALTTFDVRLDALADTVMRAAADLAENPQAPESPERSERRVRADLVKRASCALPVKRSAPGDPR